MIFIYTAYLLAIGETSMMQWKIHVVIHLIGPTMNVTSLLIMYSLEMFVVYEPS